ncbi:MAG: hypothetical protein GXO31_05015 [Epsilonproteobacteria bacterium]|nr:hypothetical protein [Campylobacterota bacterium]
MKDFATWTLEAIRQDPSHMSWMEEKRFHWLPLAARAINDLLNDHTFLLITDREREWFARYILSKINNFKNNRPFLPILSLGTIFPFVDKIKTNEEMESLEDMLSLSFPNGYTFFYIGKSNNTRAQLAKRKDNSFIWFLDEETPNTFYLPEDELLDIKLIQLIRLFDKSIDAILFAEVEFDNL